MPLGEFQLIQQYFQHGQRRRDDVVVGIGDDGAVVRVPPGQELVLVMDTLVSGVHFPVETPAFDIGWKALAVNLSDLAAMGATADWLTLALTLPMSDTKWLEGFSQGLLELAREHDMQLIGGDTTSGPLTVTVQAHGRVPQGRALLRSGARPGDLVYVSGTVGDAAAALRQLQFSRTPAPALFERLNRPRPRLELGQALLGTANACIDISDGLLADLQHILEASAVGARIHAEQIPLSDAYRAVYDDTLPALTGGDDYELLFTVAPEQRERVEALARELGMPLTRIGEILSEPGLTCLDGQGRPMALGHLGYQHFEGEQ